MGASDGLTVNGGRPTSRSARFPWRANS